MFKQEQSTTKLIPDAYAELLEQFTNIKIDNKVSLSPTQDKAYKLFLQNKNVLVIGSAGVGKSVVIKYIKEHTNNAQIYITATTGVASYNISGMTLHSYMGFGTGVGSLEFLLKKIYKRGDIIQRIKNTDVLVIDEISMLSAELFEKINLILQKIRRNEKFFGGIQLILSGDFYQLLPVFKGEYQKDKRLLIQSPLFNRYFTENNTVVLQTNYRQKDDQQYSSILSKIRINNPLSALDLELLYSRIIRPKNQNVIEIVPLNETARKINQKNLDALQGKAYTFRPKFTGGYDTCSYLKTELTRQFEQKGLMEVTLKREARVMLIKNLNTNLGLINGSIGTIKTITNSEVTVEFDNGQTVIISPETWELEDPVNETKCQAVQIPLILAYAITIHKSQSLSLNEAIIHLERTFCDHQVYVALSRVKTLNGLYLTSFSEDTIRLNQQVHNFFENNLKQN